MWMTCEKFDNTLYARLDPIGALRRILGNVVEDLAEIRQMPGPCSESSQAGLGPDGADLFVGGELVTCRCGFGIGNGRALVVR